MLIIHVQTNDGFSKAIEVVKGAAVVFGLDGAGAEKGVVVVGGGGNVQLGGVVDDGCGAGAAVLFRRGFLGDAAFLGLVQRGGLALGGRRDGGFWGVWVGVECKGLLVGGVGILIVSDPVCFFFGSFEPGGYGFGGGSFAVLIGDG